MQLQSFRRMRSALFVRQLVPRINAAQKAGQVVGYIGFLRPAMTFNNANIHQACKQSEGSHDTAVRPGEGTGTMIIHVTSIAEECDILGACTVIGATTWLGGMR